jgi:hypothetical protein
MYRISTCRVGELLDSKNLSYDFTFDIKVIEHAHIRICVASNVLIHCACLFVSGYEKDVVKRLAERPRRK